MKRLNVKELRSNNKKLEKEMFTNQEHAGLVIKIQMKKKKCLKSLSSVEIFALMSIFQESKLTL